MYLISLSDGNRRERGRRKELAGCGSAAAGGRSSWAEGRGTLGQAGNRRARGGKQAVHERGQ